MNITNNKRKQESRRKIEEAFGKLLQEKEIGDIRVTEICELAGVNRTTFYASYEDIYALSDKFQDSLLERLLEQFRQEMEERRSSFNFEKLFQHIYDNQLAYKTYFKLNPGGSFRWHLYDRELAQRLFEPEYLDYHIEFFGNGLNAIIRLWLQNGCKESPKQMHDILRAEYRHTKTPFG